jgi:type II secretory pathway predicted ATPase ExeA
MNLCEHFGLKHRPFTRNIAPGNLYPSEQFAECTARLEFIVDSRVFGIITGEVGAGKSTALRKLRHSLNLSDHRFLYLARSSLGPRDLYRELLHQLDVQPPWHKSEAQRLFDEKVLELHRHQGITPVVVIDEAHLWDTEMLEEVRFLTNFGIDAASPLALVLTGQTELREHLKFQKHTAIRQRAEVWFHLEGMTAEETRGYIQHHLKIAGGDPQLFSDAATDKIHRNTQGIPRRINNRCRAALLDAFMRDRNIIEEQSIERVINEFANDTDISD